MHCGESERGGEIERVGGLGWEAEEDLSAEEEEAAAALEEEEEEEEESSSDTHQ